MRIIRQPVRELPRVAVPLTRSFLTPGGSAFRERLEGVKIVIDAILATLRDPRRNQEYDPIVQCKKALQNDPIRLSELEDTLMDNLETVLSSSLTGVSA